VLDYPKIRFLLYAGMSFLLNSLLFAALDVTQSATDGPQVHSRQDDELRLTVLFNNVPPLPGLTPGWAR
jgi:hypothetical protein